MLQAVCVTPPAQLPVSLEALKAALRIDHDDDDADLTALIGAATSYLDGRAGILGRALLMQTWQQDLPGWPRGGVIRLSLGPVRSVDSILYRDKSGAVQTLPPASYSSPLVDDLGPFVRLRGSLPDLAREDDAVSVQWVAGYGAPEDVPDNICRAIMLLVGHWYAPPSNGGGEGVPPAVRAMLGPSMMRRA
ncbi:head-tail connector protein [Xanthobacter sp. TB0139]|uniref:head-tail connector protein n=1 Tax=Xanthobacter sp. TB0139 TaxID=3459178 RepID=UPI00403A746E